MRWTVIIVMVSALASAVPAAEPDPAPRTFEYMAWCPSISGHLDGPRFEAGGGYRMGLGAGQSDIDGNIWWGGRVLEIETGLIKTVIGDDCWMSYIPADEGPAHSYSGYNEAAGFGWISGDMTIQGSPLKGGDKGCLYLSTATRVTRVWKNPDKGGRWWFRKVIGEGPTPAPQTKGQSIGALDAKLSVSQLSVHPGNRLIVYGGGSFYEYKDEKLICLMGFNDYSKNIPKAEKIDGTHAGSLGLMGGDGMFYVSYYFQPGVPRVDRIHPDGKVELYLQDRYNRCQDGPGNDMGMFCGPHIWAGMNNYNFIPPDTLFLQSHDDSYIRRARNGRTSTYCADGEWREVNRGNLGQVLAGFRNWHAGPNGTAITMNDRICKGLTFRVTGIDYDKAVIGPPQGAPPEDAAEKKEVKP